MRGWLLIALLVWSGMVLWSGSNSGLPLPHALFFLLSGLGLGAWWVCAFAFLPEWRRNSRNSKTKRLPYLIPGPLLIGIVLCIWLSGTAFRVRFSLSQAALTRYVQALPPGTTRAYSGRVGLLDIQEEERLPGGVVRLITSEDRFLDHAGVVYCRAGMPPVVGEDSYQHLGGPWWHWRRSW